MAAGGAGRAAGGAAPAQAAASHESARSRPVRSNIRARSRSEATGAQHLVPAEPAVDARAAGIDGLLVALQPEADQRRRGEGTRGGAADPHPRLRALSRVELVGAQIFARDVF